LKYVIVTIGITNCA